MPHALSCRATVSIEQSVLLWCMRACVAVPRDDAAVRDALAHLGAASAWPAFARFITVVRDYVPDMVVVNSLAWRGVGADELALLDVLALAQEKRSMEALLLLRGLLAPEAAAAALHWADEVAACLARAGWMIAATTPTVRRVALAA
ncbi:MAG TPA: hypothetical protein VMB71_13685 [Acetobacteraceae bacterium]|nr:hypothetical protein [Acetobacteraceae bacterium]